MKVLLPSRWLLFSRWLIAGYVSLATVWFPTRGLAGGLESAGNTDGVLTWRLGTLEHDKPLREVVLLTYDRAPAAVLAQLGALRKQFASMPAPPAVSADAPTSPHVWIENSTTDFALLQLAFFRWDWTQRQSLRDSRGGQLSQFTWYIHYGDAAGQHRAGIPHFDNRTPENVRRGRAGAEALVDRSHGCGRNQ